jgi:hypothetical protein
LTTLDSFFLSSLVFIAAACAGAPDEKSVHEDDVDAIPVPTIVVAEIPADSDIIDYQDAFSIDSLDVVATADLDAELVADYGDFCACTDYKCRTAWVEETFGCGTCVLVGDCAGQEQHSACSACE